MKKKATIKIVTPQFKRTEKLTNQFIPKNKKEFFDAIEKDESELLTFGFRLWGNTHKMGQKNIWLFPGEWYNRIPNGFEVIDISGQKERFIKGTTDNDIRFGCLPYGIIK